MQLNKIFNYIKRIFLAGSQFQLEPELLEDLKVVFNKPKSFGNLFTLCVKNDTPQIPFCLKNEEGKECGDFYVASAKERDSRDRPVIPKGKFSLCKPENLIFKPKEHCQIKQFFISYEKSPFKAPTLEIYDWESSQLIGRLSCEAEKVLILGSNLSAELNIFTLEQWDKDAVVIDQDLNWLGFLKQNKIEYSKKIISIPDVVETYSIIIKSCVSAEQLKLILSALLFTNHQHLIEGFGVEGG